MNLVHIYFDLSVTYLVFSASTLLLPLRRHHFKGRKTSCVPMGAIDFCDFNGFIEIIYLLCVSSGDKLKFMASFDVPSQLTNFAVNGLFAGLR